MKLMKKVSACLTATLLGVTAMTSLVSMSVSATSFSASTTAAAQGHTSFSKNGQKTLLWM